MMNFNARIPADVFGFNSRRTVLGFCPTAPAPGTRFVFFFYRYTFIPDVFEQLRLWWESADPREPLFISGPAGCGKTSMVMQFLARVNAPAVTLTCRRRMDKYELIGQWGAAGNGSLIWIDGPATIAWRTGAVLVVNEPTTAPADVWVACNDILEGDSILIDRNGETVPRHPNTRVVFTDNCALGSETDLSGYIGRNNQDESVRDRCWHLQMQGPDTATQIDLLLRKTAPQAEGLDPKKVKALCTAVVKFGAWVQEEQSHDNSVQTVRSLSSRTLIRLLSILLTFLKTPGSIKNPVQTALRLALTDSLDTTAAAGLQNATQYCVSELRAVFA